MKKEIIKHSEENIRNAFRRVWAYATNQDTKRNESLMSIPANRDKDADLILSDAIDELMQYRKGKSEVKEIWELDIGTICYVIDGTVIKSKIVGVDSQETADLGSIVYLCGAKWGQLLLTKKDIFRTKEEAEKKLKELKND